MDYWLYHRDKLVTSPTWADFTINAVGSKKSSLHETIIAHNDDGVPIKVYISGEEWDIVKVDYFNDVIGHISGDSFTGTQAQCNCSQKLIAYIQTKDPTLLRINLMHEIFHAGACIHGGDTWWNSINPTPDRNSSSK